MKKILLILLLSSTAVFAQQLRTDISVHDPVMAKQGDTYYLFCTGMGIAQWSSKDLINWKQEASIFSKPPEWAVAVIPGFRGHIWAPDISFNKGTYYVYYSVSAFGKNTSAIGVVTNTTLDPSDPAYKWVDHGKVIQSFPGKTNWNAIDPNLIADDKGTPYLTFGSFWDGLKIVKLNADRLSIAESPEHLKTIASRKKIPSSENPPSIDNNPKDAGGNAIEAPFVFKKGKYYYLFASTDYCCKGVNSSYKMIVGRSKNVAGPYLDKAGVPMDRAGGTLILEGDDKWHGVGHSATYTFDDKDYIIFHGYDATDNGRAKLRVSELSWEKGWPSLVQK